MATTPTTSTTFQPAFKRVAQQGRHDDTFAAIAILTGKTLDSIMRQAETMGLPKIGPFHSYIDGDLIARICAAHGLVCTIWKECSKGYAEIPEVAIAMVSYDADWELGRCVVYHRNTASDGKTSQPYVVDPYPHTDSRLHFRVGTAALAELPPAWFIGVTQMNKAAAK